jgi:hypothetical protein
VIIPAEQLESGWEVVVVACWAERDLLSRWEEELLVKCSKRLAAREGLTKAQKEKLHEIYIERYFTKIPSPDREAK